MTNNVYNFSGFGGGIIIPSGNNTSDKPSAAASLNGLIRYNTGTNLIEFIANGVYSSLATISISSNNTIISNISGGSAVPTANSITSVIDILGAAQGDILYRNSSVWTALAPGSAGQVLVSGGVSGNPSWSTITGTGTVSTSGTPASGNLAKFSGSTLITNGDLSGDITTSGTLGTTLATVNTNTGSWGSSTAIPNFTVNGKGLITAARTNEVIAPAGTLSGTTLQSTVVNSSLTSVGTISTGTWYGSIIGPNFGGTGLNNGGNTLSLAGNVTFSGSYDTIHIMPGAYRYLYPAPVSMIAVLVDSTVDTLSSLASVGTITSGTWNGSTIPVLYGGTGVTTSTGSGANVLGTSPTINGNTVTSPLINKINVKTYTTGTSTYTPSTGMVYAVLECWGGGGGGGGAVGTTTFDAFTAGSGGAGGYSKSLCSAATIGGSRLVAVGAGGGGGPGSAPGYDGGISSVGTLCVANGGSGGFASNGIYARGGIGGAVGTGNVIAASGANASTGIGGNVSYLPGIASEAGASSSIGQGGYPTIVTGSIAYPGNNATGYASGGSGAVAYGVTSSSSAAGGNGSPGYVIITEYISA